MPPRPRLPYNRAQPRCLSPKRHDPACADRAGPLDSHAAAPDPFRRRAAYALRAQPRNEMARRSAYPWVLDRKLRDREAAGDPPPRGSRDECARHRRKRRFLYPGLRRAMRARRARMGLRARSTQPGESSFPPRREPRVQRDRRRGSRLRPDPRGSSKGPTGQPDTCREAVRATSPRWRSMGCSRRASFRSRTW